MRQRASNPSPWRQSSPDSRHPDRLADVPTPPDSHGQASTTGESTGVLQGDGRRPAGHQPPRPVPEAGEKGEATEFLALTSSAARRSRVRHEEGSSGEARLRLHLVRRGRLLLGRVSPLEVEKPRHAAGHQLITVSCCSAEDRSASSPLFLPNRVDSCGTPSKPVSSFSTAEPLDSRGTSCTVAGFEWKGVLAFESLWGRHLSSGNYSCFPAEGCRSPPSLPGAAAAARAAGWPG